MTAPHLIWYLTEPTRAVVDLGRFATTRALLRSAPTGDGHTVLVLPGLAGTDLTTTVLRRFLVGLGYDVHGWGLGWNLGPSEPALRGMRELLGRLAARAPVSLVGWSLGGIFARELARERPELVRQVVTLGSPYRLTDLRDTRVNPLYRFLARLSSAVVAPPPAEAGRPPFPVPATSLYSKSDGIVPWRSCREEPGGHGESVEVVCSHLGYAHNPAVLWAVADRLAQPAGGWRPFVPPAGLAGMYPR
ncbi:alpha/beta hydrolase [Saccharothrix violaceirubra]|uniref:Pimeloyl-ACP methyl ester carboxylesterase n=1 Tax=Saccharothrix violaceirubra TaxID=413306 RepID=A0A7W7WXI3_9PSEU|nr:alpha/beta hydrolase [Saccharothrix violaceirubra]MBB4967126.1 pimeloyl-ACP methyl ester carboxylesterase [Saccharothrix violaceirubra]